MSLRHDVENVLPNWESWYPSLFDAAVDLGIIKAQVCSPSQLLLSRRHSGVHSAAIDAHRENWGGVLQDVATPLKAQKDDRKKTGGSRRRRRPRRRKR